MRTPPLIAVLLLFVSGCATLPACPRANVSMVQTPQGVFFIFDEPNMEKLAGRMRQIQERSCDPDAEPPQSAAPVALPKPAAAPDPGWVMPTPNRKWEL